MSQCSIISTSVNIHALSISVFWIWKPQNSSQKSITERTCRSSSLTHHQLMKGLQWTRVSLHKPAAVRLFLLNSSTRKTPTEQLWFHIPSGNFRHFIIRRIFSIVNARILNYNRNCECVCKLKLSGWISNVNSSQCYRIHANRWWNTPSHSFHQTIYLKPEPMEVDRQGLITKVCCIDNGQCVFYFGSWLERLFERHCSRFCLMFPKCSKINVYVCQSSLLDDSIKRFPENVKKGNSK